MYCSSALSPCSADGNKDASTATSRIASRSLISGPPSGLLNPAPSIQTRGSLTRHPAIDIGLPSPCLRASVCPAPGRPPAEGTGERLMAPTTAASHVAPDSHVAPVRPRESRRSRRGAAGRLKAALQLFGGDRGANWRFATWACSPETMTTADRWASFLFLAAVVSGGCAYYSPQSLVATNILATDRDAFSHSSIRVEGQVCGNRLLSIPFSRSNYGLTHGCASGKGNRCDWIRRHSHRPGFRKLLVHLFSGLRSRLGATSPTQSEGATGATTREEAARGTANTPGKVRITRPRTVRRWRKARPVSRSVGPLTA